MCIALDLPAPQLEVRLRHHTSALVVRVGVYVTAPVASGGAPASVIAFHRVCGEADDFDDLFQKLTAGPLRPLGLRPTAPGAGAAARVSLPTSLPMSPVLGAASAPGNGAGACSRGSDPSGPNGFSWALPAATSVFSHPPGHRFAVIAPPRHVAGVAGVGPPTPAAHGIWGNELVAPAPPAASAPLSHAQVGTHGSARPLLGQTVDALSAACTTLMAARSASMGAAAGLGVDAATVEGHLQHHLLWLAHVSETRGGRVAVATSSSSSGVPAATCVAAVAAGVSWASVVRAAMHMHMPPPPAHHVAVHTAILRRTHTCHGVS